MGIAHRGVRICSIHLTALTPRRLERTWAGPSTTSLQHRGYGKRPWQLLKSVPSALSRLPELAVPGAACHRYAAIGSMPTADRADPSPRRRACIRVADE